MEDHDGEEYVPTVKHSVSFLLPAQLPWLPFQKKKLLILTMRSWVGGGLAAALHSECTRALWLMDDKYFSKKKKEILQLHGDFRLFGTLDYARFILVLDGYCVETFLTSFFPVSSIFEAERKGGSSPSFIPSWIRIRCYRHVPNWKVEWTASRLETLRSLRLLKRWWRTRSPL